MDPPLFSFDPAFYPQPPLPTHHHPQNPNRNANPNPFPIPNPSNADLPTVILLLRDLAALAESTLESVSGFLSAGGGSSGGLCRCPYDSRHRMPPESLFRHSLLCPAAPGAPLPDLRLLETLRYTNSFKTESQLERENRFVRPLQDSDADLCFSLDGELGDLGSNFFYKDCPGVVTTPEPNDSGRTFTLPGFLAIECANFVSDSDEEVGVLGEDGVRILPSEFWAVRSEVEAWRDFPVSYSYAVLRVASSLDRGRDGVLKEWVISNAPRYGIVIDGAMRDHIYLLLKLCLKVIRSEAVSTLKLLSSEDGPLDQKSVSLECPKLMGSLNWLASQLSVLYGETSAKFFAIAMLKEALICAGSSLSLINIEEKMVALNSNRNANGDGAFCNECESANPKCVKNLRLGKHSEDAVRGKVFVSQVAAAVAALLERSLLEEKIKALRFAQPLSRPQLLAEHSFASARGCEERAKRINYRPILEHDGLLWQRSQNQDLGKPKTREELLAEERDYKRRRMSYRGKKVKRTSREVLRDIIEEHMEEIKQAGGIGCNVKVAADTAVSLKCNSQTNVNADLYELQRSGYDLYETSKDSFVNKKSLHGDVSQSDRSDISYYLQSSRQKPKHGSFDRREDCESSTHERDNKYRSRSSSIHGNSVQLGERNAYSNVQGDMEAQNSKYDQNDSGYSLRLRDDISRSSSKSKYSKRDFDCISENRQKERARSYKSRRSESANELAFEDRYDPSGV